MKQVYAVFGISCQGNKQANFKCCIRTRTTHILCFYTENTSRGYHKMHQGGLMFFRLQFLCFIMAGVWRNITRQVQWEPVIFICLHVTVTLDLPWFTHKRITLRLFLTFADFVILLFTVHCTVNQNFEVSYIFLENSNQMFEYMKFPLPIFKTNFTDAKFSQFSSKATKFIKFHLQLLLNNSVQYIAEKLCRNNGHRCPSAILGNALFKNVTNFQGFGHNRPL